MAKKLTARQRAIRRRNRFWGLCVLIVLLIIALICVACNAGKKSDQKSPDKNGTASVTSKVPETPVDTRPQTVTRGNYELDAKYENLLLVNGWHPLPDDFDYDGHLTTIDTKYREPGYNLDQIDETVYPYLCAMCEAAAADGVHLAVCSPYRSYAIQETLFNRQVEKQIANGVPRDQAEEVAATIVARPGTSEHHTGLACDFIKADDVFEQDPAFGWLQKNAADYGFIMRYPKEKEEQTGVIYESWHYRFVGIYKAQEIKETGLCLEEYLAQYGQ